MEIIFFLLSVAFFGFLFWKTRKLAQELAAQKIEAVKTEAALRKEIRELSEKFQAVSGKYEEAAEAAREADAERARSEKIFQDGLAAIINFSSQKVKDDG